VHLWGSRRPPFTDGRIIANPTRSHRNTSATQDSTANIQRVSYGAGVASSEAGLGFYYGGYLNNLTNPEWTGPPMATSNLLIFDMDTGSISNNTGYNNTGIAEGTMVYIPASSAGLLIYFGGVTYPYGNGTAVGVGHKHQSVGCTDIARHRWTRFSSTTLEMVRFRVGSHRPCANLSSKLAYSDSHGKHSRHATAFLRWCCMAPGSVFI